MAVTVRVPGPLRSLTGGAAEVSAEGTTVEQVLLDLDRLYPGFAARVREPGGGVKQFVNIYLNDEDVRFSQGLETRLHDGDALSILPAVAGGC